MSDTKVHQLPWPRLNSLLFGFPGISIEAATKGGVADGEVMAICGPMRSFRTTVAVWIAAHFIEKLHKKVTFFTYNDTFIREAVAGARLDFPLSGPVRPKKLTYWKENGHELDVFDPRSQDAPKDLFIRTSTESGAIFIDADTTSGTQASADFIHGAKYIAQLRNVPVFCTFILGRQAMKSVSPLDRISDRISAPADHVLFLNPTEDRRQLVMELVCSREGKEGVLLIDGVTLKELL